MRSLAEQIGGRCKHFTGIGRGGVDESKDACKAGVVYATVTIKGSGFAGIPCFREGESVPCEKRCFPTPEEVAAEVAEHNASWERLELGIGAASEDAKRRGFKKGNGGGAFVTCPVCKTGDLYYTVASYNGHMWGRCSTKDCVAWTQ